jgi:LysR family glycine cleavage system transcriptional activator
MAKSPPPLTWLRAFEAAARHLSFTLAAEELGFTQSAISQHVRALEDRLGAQLFVRGHRALVLTDAGRLMLPDVAAAMGLLVQATERFLPEKDKPTLIVATSDSIAHWVIAPNIAEFLNAHPDIAVQLVTTVWPDDFVATNADVEIRFGAPSVVGRDAQRLRPCFLHLVATPDIARSRGTQTLAAWLPGQTLIQPVGLSTGWGDIAKRLRSTDALHPSLLVDTHGMAVDLALGGAGIALCHGLVSRQAVRQGELVDLGLAHIDAKEGYFLAAKTTALPDPQRRFLDWFATLIAT